ncbi:MAG: rRNA cytosine-C5-methyltransferase [Bacteroidales bacterium]|nr:rRNA cytosine-C5-methyltransferase [Bacteroidales bacterium]
MLPEAFIALLQESYSVETVHRLCAALAESPSVSVRRNPAKISADALKAHFGENADGAVEWAPEGLYLKERPSFTLDPLFHTGAYYVQEASSMAIGALLTKAFPEAAHTDLRVLDLCAAPGGKSTHLASLISPQSLLVSNEVMQQRATVLADNLALWGLPNVVVTNNDPADFGRLESCFDLMLVDAPCSGEGMFRKDEASVTEWSPDTVRLCAARQRRILADSWPALRPGGMLIYSTCTFNHLEDEDNTDWVCRELGGECLEQRHFLPGADRGEGFYCALVRKNGEAPRKTPRTARSKTPADTQAKEAERLIRPGFTLREKVTREGLRLLKAYPEALAAEIEALSQPLKVLRSGVAVATVKGHDLIPEADLAYSTVFNNEAYPRVELDRETALHYLAHEPLLFPDRPKGYLTLCFKGLPLGFVKNLGNRSNTLHPLSRRIRMEI